ncbi:MAG: hypothetical protein EXQ99_07790 [Alphaproteobacteria bacterium]|nr:hypothetical protein [Alphaproteobacteria bacterium]
MPERPRASARRTSSSVETLHQLNLTVSTEEDRLLLRLSTSGKKEYRLWLTRRFVRALWDVLVKVAERQPGVGDQGDEEVRKALLSFQHDAAINEADFKTAYKAAALETPLGEAPVLLTSAQLKTSRSGNVELTLHATDDRTVSVRLDPKLLHSLCEMLASAAKKAEWELDLTIGKPLANKVSDRARVH